MSSTIKLQAVSSGQCAAAPSACEVPAAASSRSTHDRPSNPTSATETVYVRYTRAVKRLQKWFLACWSKLQELRSAIQRRWDLMRAFESLCSYIVECGTRLQKCLTSLGQRYTLATWLGVAVTLVIGGVSLRYAYVSIKLAEWTARKDFQESCRSLSVCR